MDEHDIVRVSREEAMAAVLQPPRAQSIAPPAPAVPQPRGNELAGLSFGLAVAGIPLVGVLLGPIALVCGAIALSAADDGGKRGRRLALAGMVLGLCDFVGWGIGIWMLLTSAPPATKPRYESPSFAAEPALDIANAPPRIQHALRANARVECNGPGAGAGSGVVIADSATAIWVLTNEHVAHCAGQGSQGTLRVFNSEGAAAAAQIRWTAPGRVDAVLLRVGSLPGFESIRLERRTASVGDPVFIVGNPLGLASTYSEGAVSAVRSLRQGERELHVFQIQAPVNHGNSGGGLYNRAGELLGLVTWAADKKLADGIGFAISVDDIVGMLEAEPDVWREISEEQR